MPAGPSPDEVLQLPAFDRAAMAVLAEVLEGMTGAALVFTRDGRLCAANRAARGRFAIDVRAPLASQREGIVLAALAEPFAALLDLVRSGANDAIETRWIEQPAQWVELRVAACGDGLLLLTVADVTDRETSRVALARAERETAAMLELMPSSARIADLSGRILHMNATALADYDAPVPQTLRAVWERDRPRRLDADTPMAFLETAAMRALAGMTVRREPTAVLRSSKGELMVLEVSAAPIIGEQGRVVGVVLLERDVTNSRRPDDASGLGSSGPGSSALTEREDSISRDRRLAAIGQLAAGVMHDVNNALNPIMAAAYLLRHHAESPDAVRDYADRIRKAAETGAATASRVGRFIRQEPSHGGADVLLDLSVLAEEVLELTEPMPQRRATDSAAIHVVRQFGDGVQTRGNPGEIREALFNLVSNAMDAMKHGGTLTVTTQLVGDEARVIVQDNGAGMTEEVRERAFEPFFSTKGAKGSGLGLAEVYGIARRHRGSVTIESSPSTGTSVAMRFPAERGVLPPEVVDTQPADTEPLHILVVEDHEDGREFLKRLLNAHGHTVDAVSSCAEARGRLAATAASAYHLMLTDVGLPDGSGWDLVAYARERLPALRIGVITGWEPMVSSNEAVGAEFVLRKPLRAAELLDHIAGRKAPASPG